MLAELAASRAQINAFLTNHMEHLRQENDKNAMDREANTKALLSISESMKEQTECLQLMQRDILEIKGKIT